MRAVAMPRVLRDESFETRSRDVAGFPKGMLEAFAPTNAPPDIGLDALYVVTDATASASAPHLDIAVKPANRNVVLTWQGPGRVFQVERADDVTGPFQPLSAILTDLFFDDPRTFTNRAQSYYRLRQW